MKASKKKGNERKRGRSSKGSSPYAYVMKSSALDVYRGDGGGGGESGGMVGGGEGDGRGVD